MKDERLALIFKFEDAPQELKDIAEQHKTNWLRLQKAQAQARLWRLESGQAEDVYKRSLDQFDKGLKKWDPANVSKPDLEDIGEKE